MSKTSTELTRHALNGPSMGTRWSAVFFTPAGFDAQLVQAALQAAASEIDAQMSLWKPESDLVRINTAPVGEWLEVPRHLMNVLSLGLAIGRATGGAFDMGVGDAVSAWGFGPERASAERIRAAERSARAPLWEKIEINGERLVKRQAVALDLNGIAKGYGVDRLAETLKGFGITSFLAAIDGELRAAGRKPDGEVWTVAIEEPDHRRRARHSLLGLADAAVATSGDYRHYVEAKGMHLSHTMDPRRGVPLANGPASVTVVAEHCAEADAWATALMVLGVEKGTILAERLGIDALFLLRGAGEAVTAVPVGPLFNGSSRSAA